VRGPIGWAIIADENAAKSIILFGGVEQVATGQLTGCKGELRAMAQSKKTSPTKENIEDGICKGIRAHRNGENRRPNTLPEKGEELGRVRTGGFQGQGRGGKEPKKKGELHRKTSIRADGARKMLQGFRKILRHRPCSPYSFEKTS